MKTDFKINKELKEKFSRETLKINSGTFRFLLSEKNDIKQSYKLIANAIQDNWSALNVKQDEKFITIQLNRRKKKTFKFPEGDTHFVGKITDRYQYHTFLSSLPYIKGNNLAIDAGGHVGVYSFALKEVFKTVLAFEPAPNNIRCFLENVPDVKLYKCGLGDEEKEVSLNISKENSGNNSIVESFGEKSVSIQIKTLDSFHFKGVDLIKLDVQGYEKNFLIGAKQTLIDNDCVIIAELITHKNSPPNEEALAILKSYGYKVRIIMGKDYIFQKE